MKRILSLWLPNWTDPRKNAAPAATGSPLNSFNPEPTATAQPASRRTGFQPVPVPESGRVENPSHREKSLTRLARWCERYSPLVGFAAEGEPADLLLDVTGIGPLFGGEEKLAEQLTTDLAARGYSPRIAIAGTIGAAWALAHYGINDECGMMNDECKRSNGPPHSTFFLPHSSFIIHHSSFVFSALSPLPVEALRLPAETIALLHQLGVSRIEELLRLPRASLSSRFGEGTSERCPLLERLDQASGAAEEVIVPYRPPPEYQAEWALEHPLEDRAAVEKILAELIESVARQLAPRRQGAVRLECRFDCTGSEPLRLEVGLVCPSAESQYLLDLLRLQLERQTWPGPVGRVGLQVTLAAPLADRQQELFPDGAKEAERHLALLVDRLSGRLGNEAVLRPQLLPDAQPERAWRYVSLVGRRTHKSRSRRTGFQPVSQKPRRVKNPSYEERSQEMPPALARPLQILSPPLAIETLAAAPDGPPARFTYLRKTRRVARHWGPERIETGWWRGRTVRRDYYRVETEDGRRYWLFRRLDDGQWFLHGSFS